MDKFINKIILLKLESFSKIKRKRFFFVFLIILIFIITCKSTNTIDKISSQEKINNDKYQDFYKNNIYKNTLMKISIDFDDDWVVKTLYKDFDKFEKDFSDYFNTADNEVLFIGYNNKKSLGVRFVVEKLSLSIDDYYTKINESNLNDTSKYQIEILKNEKIMMKNFEGYYFNMMTTINKNNIFIFDSLLFKNGEFDYRIDFWIKKDNYTTHKQYIKDIMQSIDFF